MTDIELMIEEIKEFNKNLKYEEIDAHLVFMCHPDTKKLIKTAFAENKITINKEFVHIYESNYYSPGDIYKVTDNKVKRRILKQHGLKVQGEEYTIYKTYYNYDINTVNITTTYATTSTSSNSTGSIYGWR